MKTTTTISLIINVTIDTNAQEDDYKPMRTNLVGVTNSPRYTSGILNQLMKYGGTGGKDNKFMG